MNVSMLTKDQLAHSLIRNSTILLDHQRKNGAVNGYCKSRILESALMFHLLKSQSHLLKKQKEIKDFLSKSIAEANLNKPIAIEQVIVEMAEQLIGNRSAFSGSSKQLVNTFLNREQGRKAIYFGCLFAEVGLLEFSSLPFQVDAFEEPKIPVQTWAKVMLCSLKVLYCFGMSKQNLITAEEKEFLKEKLFKNAVFENNVLTQIVGLLALSKLYSKNVLEKPLKALLNWQQKDGGMPLMTGLDNFITPLAGLALLDVLPNIPKRDQKNVEESIFKMAEYLKSEQVANGGWSYMQGTTQTDMDDSGLCGAFLAMINGKKYKDKLERVAEYKVEMQHTDGGYPTYIKGNPSTPSMTAAALHGVAEMLSCKAIEFSKWEISIRKTLKYLVAVQNNNGTYERRWSNAETHALFRVAVALRSVQKNTDIPVDFKDMMATISNKMITYLKESQNSDGGWGRTLGNKSDLESTGYAILCCTKREQNMATKGIKFLEQLQQDKLVCNPDLLGPRPIPYDIPVLPTLILTYSYGHFIQNILSNN